ncbi:MAG: polysaccharide deacetylase family protein [Thermoanaerobaculia bacterium]
MSSASFAAVVTALARQGYKGVTLSHLLEPAKEETSAKPVGITFDDGYESVFQEAFPILERLGWKATLFLVTDFCGATNQWPSQPRGIPSAPLLDWKAVETLAAAGWEIAPHTRTHPPLSQVRFEVAEEEILFSRRVVDERTGQKAEVFSYPYGDVSHAIKKMVAQHFRAAVGTRLGIADTESDIYNLERIDSYYVSGKDVLLESPAFRAYLSLRGVLRRLSRIGRHDWASVRLST